MRLHHRLDGPPGAPVLVVPSSLGTTLELWAATAPAWTRRFRVLRYDQRGHGGSEVPAGPYAVDQLGRDALELLDRLSLGRVSFCGLSLGGATGMWLAANAPERIERLVLACTSPRFGNPEAWRERARVVREHGPDPIADTVVRRWFALSFAQTRPDLVTRFRELFLATPREGYAGSCEALAEWDFRRDLATIRTPTLVIAGAEDERAPPADARAIAGGIPGARLVELPGVGHLASVEQPAAFAALVTGHLAARPAAEVA